MGHPERGARGRGVMNYAMYVKNALQVYVLFVYAFETSIGINLVILNKIYIKLTELYK